MRYMMLIYSREGIELSEDDAARIRSSHATLMREATEKGVLVGAEPLSPTTSATTLRTRDGKVMVTDGPFAETKEQLAGYYIIDCKDLEEAKEWAAKIPTCRYQGDGCVEIRPMPGVAKILETEMAGARNA
jgi:hypothetical protein